MNFRIAEPIGSAMRKKISRMSGLHFLKFRAESSVSRPALAIVGSKRKFLREINKTFQFVLPNGIVPLGLRSHGWTNLALRLTA